MNKSIHFIKISLFLYFVEVCPLIFYGVHSILICNIDTSIEKINNKMPKLG